ncbi:uncharacterized protein LOC129909606 [Episyrphus balteatus]|uniref:uncharacterized protein LOC129909606 n=1 Tax=Episyrphus balteatus TaxID=286459 RepID=UPI0024865790|nr:uncharacterized protein LOC129909606 [Episyrphus balteatus]
MNSIVFLVVLAIFVSTSSAANLTVASSNEEYTALWNRKFQNDIYVADMKIECVDGRGADSIRVMKDQQEEILKEIKRYQDSLVPVEALSLIRKHCVQKYKTMLVTYETAQAQFATCIATAQSRVNTLTTTAKNTVAAAKASANTNLPRAIVSCNTTYFSNPQKHEECVINNIDSYANSIQTNMRNIDKNLDASLCTSTDLARDAIQCAFGIERNVLLTIGKVTTLIDSCMKETETICPCAKNLMVESVTPSVAKLLAGNVTRT